MRARPNCNVIDRLCARVERYRRPIAWVVVALLLTAAAVLRCAWPPSHPVSELLEELGVVLIATSVAGRIFCMMYIGGQKNQTILRAGPYSVCRNPLYLFSTLAAAGAGLSAGSATLGVLFGASFFALFAAIVRSEEARLKDRFGEPYVAYLEQVPRWVPAFALWRDPEQLSPRVGLIVRTLRDSAALFLAIPMLEALEYAHLAGILPAFAAVP